jgi:4-amino-4-deoxy-L-arabinose transferase-like glycosyltransferase
MPEDSPEAAENRRILAGKNSRRVLYSALFFTGFVLRFGFVLWRKTYVSYPPSVLPFGLEICSIAAHIVRGQGYSSPFLVDTGPTAWIAPVYPYMVAVVFRLFGIFSQASALVILGLQCAMAGATCVAIHALGRRTMGPQVALWAAWIFTVSPIFFRWPVSWIWDFTASALLLSIALIVSLDTAQDGTKKSWWKLGAIWALIALTNPALLAVLPFSFGYATYMSYRERRDWLRSLALAGVVFAVLVAPWLIRNDVVFGHPVFFRGNMWFEFHLGNYHDSNGLGFSGKHPTNNPAELQRYAAMGEQRYIQWAKDDALHFVREYPGEFVNLSLHRAWWFWDGTPLLYWKPEWWTPWKFWPLSVLAWLGLLFVLTRRPRGWILYAAALVVYPMPYYLIYPVAKYRHAIEPEMLLLSVYFGNVVWSEIRAMVQRREQRRSASSAPENLEAPAITR